MTHDVHVMENHLQKFHINKYLKYFLSNFLGDDFCPKVQKKIYFTLSRHIEMFFSPPGENVLKNGASDNYV